MKKNKSVFVLFLIAICGVTFMSASLFAMGTDGDMQNSIPEKTMIKASNVVSENVAVDNGVFDKSKSVKSDGSKIAGGSNLYFDEKEALNQREIQKAREIRTYYDVDVQGKVSVRSAGKDEMMKKYIQENFIMELDDEKKFDYDEFKKVMTNAFQKIYEEFYLPISYETMLGYAIEGLGYYAPKLKLTRAGGRLLVHYDLKLVGSFSLPENKNNPNEWVDFLANVFNKTRAYSPSLSKAGVDELYFVLLTYLLQSIDANSEYVYPAKVAKLERGYSVNNSLGFTYRRVGDGVQVLSLLNNSPAFMSGIEEGDLITHIYGDLVKNMTDEKIESVIYSNSDAIIHIKYISYNSQLEREAYLRTVNISPNTVSSKYDEKTQILTVNIHNFVKGTAYNLQTQIDENLKKYDNKISGYIIDLRGNTGGVLEEALESANLFVDKGTMLETVGKKDDMNKVYKASSGDIGMGKPVVVLADGTTQSSAEFFAGIIQSTGRGIMIGSPTYGKGTIQKNISLPNKSYLKLSVGESFLGNKNVINRIGVFPIVCTSTILDEKDLDTFSSNVLSDKFKVKYETFVVKKGVVNPIGVISGLRETCLGIYPNMKYIDFLNKIAANIIVQKNVYEKLLKKLSE